MLRNPELEKQILSSLALWPRPVDFLLLADEMVETVKQPELTRAELVRTLELMRLAGWIAVGKDEFDRRIYDVTKDGVALLKRLDPDAAVNPDKFKAEE